MASSSPWMKVPRNMPALGVHREYQNRHLRTLSNIEEWCHQTEIPQYSDAKAPQRPNFCVERKAYRPLSRRMATGEHWFQQKTSLIGHRQFCDSPVPQLAWDTTSTPKDTNSFATTISAGFSLLTAPLPPKSDLRAQMASRSQVRSGQRRGIFNDVRFYPILNFGHFWTPLFSRCFFTP